MNRPAKELGHFKIFLTMSGFYNTIRLYIDDNLNIFTHGSHYDVEVICYRCYNQLKYIEDIMVCEKCGEVVDNPHEKSLRFIYTKQAGGYAFK